MSADVVGFRHRTPPAFDSTFDDRRETNSLTNGQDSALADLLVKTTMPVETGPEQAQPMRRLPVQGSR